MKWKMYDLQIIWNQLIHLEGYFSCSYALAVLLSESLLLFSGKVLRCIEPAELTAEHVLQPSVEVEVTRVFQVVANLAHSCW